MEMILLSPAKRITWWQAAEIIVISDRPAAVGADIFLVSGSHAGITSPMQSGIEHMAYQQTGMIVQRSRYQQKTMSGEVYRWYFSTQASPDKFYKRGSQEKYLSCGRSA
jgi:hypothetical protein